MNYPTTNEEKNQEMDSMSLSLDDIIKKNKSQKVKKGKGGPVKKINKVAKGPNKRLSGGIQKKKAISPKKQTITDARLKLIQSNRQKIADAREIIAKQTRSTIKDARELLSRKKPVVRNKPARIPRSRSAVLAISNDIMIDEDMDDLELTDINAFKSKPITSLRRTVKNDGFRSGSPPRNMPRLPVFSIPNREPSPALDPFDCYIPTRRPVLLPPSPPTRSAERFHPAKIMSAHMDAYAKPVSHKGILRQSSRNDDHDDRFESDRYMPRDERKSRYATESAGIFANVADYKSPPRVKGYRILISNLVPSVSAADVEELFSEIGDLVSVKMVKLGTVEVIFCNKGDDERAHDVYHNRLIDGEPMKITLTGPYKSSAASSSSSSYYRS